MRRRETASCRVAPVLDRRFYLFSVALAFFNSRGRVGKRINNQIYDNGTRLRLGHS
jgi:hypothetical protein